MFPNQVNGPGKFVKINNLKVLCDENDSATTSRLCCAKKFERMLYAVRCLKSNEDMILALAGQFKQLSHEPEKFR